MVEPAVARDAPAAWTNDSDGSLDSSYVSLAGKGSSTPPVWIAGELVPPTGSEVKAKPSPSPLVTPALGEKLCRMSSQHV